MFVILADETKKLCDGVMKSYSVLMSVYYKENPEFLRQSIYSMIDQTVQTDNFILVCDGPLTEELDEVIACFSEKYPTIFNVIRLKVNQGLGHALNVGLRHCKNELVARMDSDDISVRERCSMQMRKFAENPELTVVSGTVKEFMGSAEHITAVKILPEQHEDIYEYAKMRCPFNHPAVMYRKSAVLCAGGYQEVPLYEVYDLWVRMLIRGAKAYNFPETLCLMRADSGLYNRRGGWSYLKKVAAFRTRIRKMHFCTFLQYIIGICGQGIVCLVPSSLRRWIYMHFLRKSNKNVDAN